MNCPKRQIQGHGCTDKQEWRGYLTKYSMNYDQEQEQWLVELQERDYALHCGESFQLFIGKKPISCRLELADKWYVIIGSTSFDLRENEQYMIYL